MHILWAALQKVFNSVNFVIDHCDSTVILIPVCTTNSLKKLVPVKRALKKSVRTGYLKKCGPFVYIDVWILMAN